jgi:predicted RNA-binding Zn ribbon-like protein
MRQDRAAFIRSLSPGRAGRLPLVGGRLCLNFVNTSSGRGTPTHKNHLVSYGDLLAWSHHAGALDRKAAVALAGLARRQPAAAQRVVSKAVRLRETLFAIMTGLAQKRPLSPVAIDELNETLAPSLRASRLAPNADGFSWAWHVDPPSLDLPLWIVGRSAAELLTGDPLDRLKSCAGIACGWVFLDTSRNGRRRWCEMEVCGSRAKMRRYRQRHGL